MNKLAHTMMALAMTTTMLTGCGGKTESTPSTSAETQKKTEAASEAKETEATTTEAESQKKTEATSEAKETKSTSVDVAGDAAYELNLGCIANDPASADKYNANGYAIREFADKVSEYTNGQVKINIHWGGVLGSNVSMFDEVMMGSLDFHVGQPMSSADPRFAAWSLPFVYDNYDEVYAANNRETGGVFALSSQWMEENDVKLLAMGTGSFRGFISNKEIHTPEDAHDLKIRTYEDALVNHFWGNVGTASIIPGSEIYSAMQTKTVDAMEFHATGVYAYKMYEVAKYYAPLNWQNTAGTILSCSMQTWDSLPADIQESIQKAADEYAEFQRDHIKEDEKTVFQALSDEGMTIVELSDSDIQAWHDLSDSMTDFFKEYVGADVYDAFMDAVAASK